eukprot:753767-Hanusia_phi.AAC.2
MQRFDGSEQAQLSKFRPPPDSVHHQLKESLCNPPPSVLPLQPPVFHLLYILPHLKDVAVVQRALKKEDEVGGRRWREDEEVVEHLGDKRTKERLCSPPRVSLRRFVPSLPAAAKLLQTSEGPVVMQGDTNVRRLNLVLATQP